LLAVGIMVLSGVGGAGAHVAAGGTGGVLWAKGKAAVALGELDLFLPGCGEDLGAAHVRN